MLDIFATVSADRFHVTWTDSAGHPRCPRSLRRNLQSLGGPLPHADNDDWLDAIHIAGIGPTDLGRAIPALLDTANADCLNLTIRPRGTGVRFIQPDDLAVEKLPTLTRRHVSHHRNDGSGPDRSRADYVWCVIAISWGHGVDDTAVRLLQETPKARGEGKSYALHTAHQAAAAAEHRQQQQTFRTRAAEHTRR